MHFKLAILTIATLASPAGAFTSTVKVINVSGFRIEIQTNDGKRYQMEASASGCDYETRIKLKGQTALFYNSSDIPPGDPFKFTATSLDPPALFILGNDIDGRCQLQRSKRIEADLQGCCSHHGGIAECSLFVTCEDGSVSRTCDCEFGEPVPKRRGE